MECLRKVKRRVGKLESFDDKPGQSFARVRTSDGLFHLPTSARGVLQSDGSIALCQNGNRYEKIPQGTRIVFDVVLDAQDKHPVPGLWAPEQKPPWR